MFKRRIILIISFIAAAFGLAMTFLLFDLSKITIDLVRSQSNQILLALIGLITLTTGNLIVRWFRWHFLVRRTVIDLSTKDSLKLYLSTIPTMATPFYFGELIRTGLLVRNQPKFAPTIVAIWLIDRFSDLFAFIVFFLISQTRWNANFAISGLLILILIYILFYRIARRVQRETGKLLFFGAIFLTGIAAWLLPVVGLKMTLGLLGSNIPWAIAFETFLGSTILGGISGIPLGFGVIGVSMVTALQSYGIGLETVVLGTAIFRAGTTWYAVSFGLINLLYWRKYILSLLLPNHSNPLNNYFDDIAIEYEKNIPAHIRDRLLHRKVTEMYHWLSKLNMLGNLHGLDVGCGQGWYVGEFSKSSNFSVTGTDLSFAQLREASKYSKSNNLDFDLLAANGGELPFRNAHFDFAYSINVFHHVPNRGLQLNIFHEVIRVLKPGGVFFLQEINTLNPLYRFYMGYVFPLIKDIDDGTELWIKPDALPNIKGAAWLEKVVYYNFLPDFTPVFLVKILSRFETYLESSVVRTGSSHYIATLVKQT